MGDGVLAYFGYPLAHEHDAERAVRGGCDRRLRAATSLAQLWRDREQARRGR